MLQNNDVVQQKFPVNIFRDQKIQNIILLQKAIINDQWIPEIEKQAKMLFLKNDGSDTQLYDGVKEQLRAEKLKSIVSLE